MVALFETDNCKRALILSITIYTAMLTFCMQCFVFLSAFHWLRKFCNAFLSLSEVVEVFVANFAWRHLLNKPSVQQRNLQFSRFLGEPYYLALPH